MSEVKHFKDIKEIVEGYLQMELKFRMEKIMIILSEHYNIDINEIHEHLKEFDSQIEEKKQTVIQKTLEINDDKCLGKTKYNTQCSRSRQRDSIFCGSHMNKLPYGRVDNPVSEKLSLKKRGRPRKEGGSPLPSGEVCPE